MIVEQKTRSGAVDSFKVVRFTLGELNLAVEIKKVHSIIELREIRKIPRVPSFIEGVINYRDKIIPVVDLRKRLSVKAKRHKFNKIILYLLGQTIVGFIVDDVSRVIQKSNSVLMPPPPVIINGLEKDCIYNIYEEENKEVILINLAKVLSRQDTDALKNVTSNL